MSRSKSPVLPGLSRSAACKGTCSDGTKCRRLAGHRGDCRPTLHAATKSPITVGAIVVLPDGTKCRVVEVVPAKAQQPKAAKAARRQPVADPEGVEVLSFDRYTVQPEPKARQARPARRTTAKQCRVVRNGQRCRRAYGHKQAGTRHAFAAVRVLPTVGPKGRDVQTITGKASRRGNYVASGKPSSRLA